jgi:hypothetical protein
MTGEYTTVRIKKATRDWLNKTAEAKGVTVHELVESFSKSWEDSTKQVLLNIDKEKYAVIQDMAQMLYGIKLIKTDKIEDAVMLAIDSLIKGMEQTMARTKNFQYAPLTTYKGQ